MRLLDEHVTQAAPVEIIRVVDDITILATSPADVGAAMDIPEAWLYRPLNAATTGRRDLQ